MDELQSETHEVPIFHFMTALGWLRAHRLHYFTHFELQLCKIQLVAPRQQQQDFRQLLSELWFTQQTLDFPRRNSILVLSELQSWGIAYVEKRSLFTFRVEVAGDVRTIDRFLDALKEFTKHHKQDKDLKKLLKNRIPDDISELME